jgi:hypothetical protein
MTQRPPWQRLVLLVSASCALATLAPVPAAWGSLGAQAAPRRGWTAVRVAKWALLGATVGLGYYALKQSTRADRAYSDLRHLCITAPSSCTLDAGRYPDGHAEALYATSLRHDRRAQAGILGGQVTLLGSAALFVYDLRNGHGPENIPFPGVPARLAVRAASAGTPRSFTRAPELNLAATAPPAARSDVRGDAR